jgi:hypothetical protein
MSEAKEDGVDVRRQAAHARAARRYGRLRARTERASASIAVVRFISFVVGALGLGAAAYDGEWIWAVMGAVGWLVFIGAVWLHRTPFFMAPRLRMLETIHAESAARLEGMWDLLPDDGARYLKGDPLRGELQLFGTGSIYQLVNRATLPAGQDRVAALIADPILTPEELPARQEAARELAPLVRLRHRLEAEGRLVHVDDETLERFLIWAEGNADRAWMKPWLGVSTALILAGWGQMIATFAFGLTTLWWQTFALNGLIFAITTKRLQANYLHLLGEQHRPFVALRRMFALIEAHPFKANLLADLQAQLGTAGKRPSERMAKLEAVVEALAVRQSELLYGVVNLALSWELWQSWRLEGWRSRNGDRLRADLAALADLEALASMGAAAHDHPDWAFATVHVDDERSPIVGTQLGHPLFDPATRVRNDFTLSATGQLVLITGSNMSGKSSFLRTVGINAVLAQAGAPICGTALDLRACRVATSIQVTDDPGQGFSRFYAEVRRIAQILRAVAAAEADASQPPQLYLVDEILSGTNSRERHLASRTIVGQLVDAQRCFGLVTTHDLDLARLSQTRPEEVPMYHFSDHFDGDALHFDYRLKPGMATTTNALHVLRLEGIEVSTEAWDDA